MATTKHTGTLRPLITYLGRKMAPFTHTDAVCAEDILETPYNGAEILKDHFLIRWIEGDDVSKVVWTEEIKCLPGLSFMPQVQGIGEFKPTGAMYVDKNNLRHRVLPVDMGVIGSQFNKVEASKD